MTTMSSNSYSAKVIAALIWLETFFTRHGCKRLAWTCTKAIEHQHIAAIKRRYATLGSIE